MLLAPCSSFVLETRRSLAETVELLRAQTQEPIGFVMRWPKNCRPFSGTVTDQGFRFRPIAAGISGVRPYVLGRLDERPGATVLYVRIVPSVFYILWVVLLCGFFAFNACRLATFGAWTHVEVGAFLLLAWLVLLLFHVCDVRRIRRSLTDAVAAGDGTDAVGPS